MDLMIVSCKDHLGRILVCEERSCGFGVVTRSRDDSSFNPNLGIISERKSKETKEIPNSIRRYIGSVLKAG